MKLDVNTLIQTCRAHVRHRGRNDYFLGVSTDTRHLKKQELFCALKGPHFDGHVYVEQAYRKGAAGALIKKGRHCKTRTGRWLLAVDDPLIALGDIAQYWRRQWGGPVVTITGSNGKTTTKEMIAAVLAQQFTVLKTEKNFNNLVGLPWTLFRLQPRHQYAVLELGMNAPGEIDRLGSIAEPQVGVITNIARAHLEGLGSLARVAKAKGELLYHLKPEGLAVLNADDPRVLALRRKTKARVVTYGFSREAALRGQDFKNDGFKGCRFKVRLRGRFYPFQLSLAGRHNAVNALAAIAVGREYGIRPQQMQQALRQITLPQGRLDRHRLAGGTLLINDSYNANPDSMHAALNLIKEQKHSGRKILFLGDMLELGPASIRFHREIGAAAVAAGADQLIAVGQNAKHLVSGAKNAGMKANEIHCSPSAKQAGKILQEIVQPGDLIFLKGSRGIHLEETLKTFTDGKAAACF